MRADNQQLAATSPTLNAYNAYSDAEIDVILAREVPAHPVCPRCGARVHHYSAACAKCRRYGR